MNKLLITSMALVMVLSFGALSFAQNTYNQGYGTYSGFTQWGIKAGADAAREYGSDSKITVPGMLPISSIAPSWRFKGGFIGGAFAKYSLNEAVGVQAEGLFAMYGSRRDVTFEGGTNYRTLLNYIEIPVMLMYEPTTTSSVHPEIFAGPTVDFLLSAKQKRDVSGSTITEDIKDQLHKTVFGATFGAGLTYPMSYGKITMDARYNLGISKIYNTTPQPNVRNSAIALMLGYSFK